MTGFGQGENPPRLVLSPDLASVPAARRFVREVLRDIGRDDLAEAAALPTTELVANAVLHARTAVTLAVIARGGHVRIEVHDESPVMPERRQYGREATTGRGLGLLELLTDDFGVVADGAGKTMWFVLGGQAPGPDLDRLPAPREVPAVHESGPRDGRVEVRLLNLPTTLWLAARQHQDAVLRELALARAADAGGADELGAADHARTLVASALTEAAERNRHAARLPLPERHPAPVPDVPASVDLTLQLAPRDARAFCALDATLDVARRLAEAGELLVGPGLLEVVGVRRWLCEEVRRQLEGAAARPWPGADAPEFAAPRADPTAAWDVSEVADAADHRIALDDTNHILAVSEPLAAIVGWEPHELVGRRVVILVPPRYREAHTAGYTRYLVTGLAHALDVDMVLPVLTRSGTEVDCWFRITATARGPRRMFVAHIRPVAAVERVP